MGTSNKVLLNNKLDISPAACNQFYYSQYGQNTITEKITPKSFKQDRKGMWLQMQSDHLINN